MANNEIEVILNFKDLKWVQLRVEALRLERDNAVREAAQLRKCLEESVGLQSHYAELLNMHDGGERMIFKSADEWIKRLRTLGDI